MSMTPMATPLLADSVASMTAQAYYDYVTSLHKAPAQREASSPEEREAVVLSFTKTGKPSVKVKGRKPPYVTASEFLRLSRTHGVRQNVLFLYLKKRNIKVTNGLEVKLK